MFDMRKKKLALVLFFGIAAVSMLFVGPASASTETCTSWEAFHAAIEGTYSYYLQDFDSHNPGLHVGSLTFNYGPYGDSYTVLSIDPVSNPPNEPYGNLWWVWDGLSIENSSNALQISFTGAKVQAVGGFFWPTDCDGENVAGDIKYALSDGTEGTIGGAKSTAFTGFVAEGDTYITSLILYAGNDLCPTINHLYVGTLATPIPGAVWLLGSGLVGLIALKRRLGGSRKRSTSVRGGPSMASSGRGRN